MLGLGVGAAFAAKAGAFEGGWKGTDLGDGSNQWMWIADFAGVHEVLYYDDLCSSCTGLQGEGPACLGVSSARLSDVDRLSMDGGVVTCMWLGDPQVLITDWTGSFVSNADGTLSDDYGNIWTPSMDKQTKVIKPQPVLPPTPTPTPVPTATPVPPSCEAPSWADPEAVVVVSMFNEAREHAGVECLRLNWELTQAAVAHARYMLVNSLFGHNEDPSLPGFTGVTAQDRANYVRPGTRVFNEFIGSGLDGAAMAQRWIDSPDHGPYILDPLYEEIGVGHDGTVWDALFGPAR
jgi:uncharacterized protein YkwD